MQALCMYHSRPNSLLSPISRTVWLMINCEQGEPPHTIAEFNFSDPLLLAWFNLSLVDGYNEDLAIIPEGRPDLAIIARAPKNGMCSPDLEFPLPGPVLKQPCLSACQRWGRPEDCCTGEFATPDKCKHSAQSLWWKGLFPEAYCYGNQPFAPI